MSQREGFAVCALAVPGGGRGSCGMDGLVSGKGSLVRRRAKDYDEDAMAGYATPRHFDECKPDTLISTHHRRRHQ